MAQNINEIISRQEKKFNNLKQISTNYKKDSTRRKTLEYSEERLSRLNTNWEKFVFNDQLLEKIDPSEEQSILSNKIPHGDADCLRRDVSTLLRKSPLPKRNITLKEVSALRELRNDESLLVLPAHKGNATVVVDTEAYEHKITQMVGDTSVYRKGRYNPTVSHDEVSQIDAPTYKLSRQLATLLQPYTGKTSSYVRDSRHFVELLEGIQLQDTDIMAEINYVESITYCLKSGYFLWRGDFYLQIDGVAMGSPLAPVVANIFMEWFEEKALESANVKPRYWWRYVDDIFAVVAWDALKDLTSHLNRVHAKVEVTIEEEKEGKLPFLDVLVIREPNGRVTHTVYRKPTHTDRYLRADSHHHPSHLSSVPRTLLNRALALCDHEYVNAELSQEGPSHQSLKDRSCDGKRPRVEQSAEFSSDLT
ncbi:uncharacterized protein LOC113507847 [Trichoplusia ni]|uniref:Uncharacterized protein LOC113507847 n=1 Tax=Trichoplusia ni TaxID=7111 RepID=A0A7E5X280_TRINI|nr:uncharacterized protein LOC113507847 [Trichoplusia ni]